MNHISTLTPPHTSTIHTLRFNSSASYLLSAGSDRQIVLSNVETGAFIKSYVLHAYGVVDLCISKDSLMFASCGGNTTYLWNVMTGTTIYRFGDHLSQVNAITFNDQENVLASASNDSTVKLWDLKGSSNRGSYSHGPSSSSSSSSSGNSRDNGERGRGASGFGGQRWENGTSIKPIMTLTDSKDGVQDVKIHDTKIVTASLDGKLRVYDIRMGKLVTSTLVSSSPKLNSAFDSSSRSNPSSSSNRSIVASPRLKKTSPPLTSVSISQDGDTALVSLLASELQLIDLSTGTLLQSFTGHSNTTYRLKSRFCLNEEYVISPSEDGYLCVWSLLEGECKRRYKVAGDGNYGNGNNDGDGDDTGKESGSRKGRGLFAYDCADTDLDHSSQLGLKLVTGVDKTIDFYELTVEE